MFLRVFLTISLISVLLVLPNVRNINNMAIENIDSPKNKYLPNGRKSAALFPDDFYVFPENCWVTFLSGHVISHIIIISNYSIHKF